MPHLYQGPTLEAAQKLARYCPLNGTASAVPQVPQNPTASAAERCSDQGTIFPDQSYSKTSGVPRRALCPGDSMVKFLLFCILLVLCWPLALAALVLYPLIWLLLLPFRLVGIAVGGVLELVRAIIFLLGRVLRAN